MTFRERTLNRMSRAHLIFFVCFFGISLLINIPGEVIATHSYTVNLIHLSIMAIIILLVLNPTGIRLVVFLLFIYLFFILFTTQSPFTGFDPNSILYGYPMHLIGFSNTFLINVHMGLYALLSYFLFMNYAPSNQQKETEVLDDFR